MNTLSGWLGLSEEPKWFPTTITDMRSPHDSRGADQQTLTGLNWLVTAPELAKGPRGIIALTLGQMRWTRSDLSAYARQHGNAATLAKVFAEIDQNFLKHVAGAFVCVILDPEDKRVFSAVDRIGQIPIYYAVTESGLVFGSDATFVAEHAAVGQHLSQQALYNYIYFHMVPSPGSIYKNVAKLPSASWLDFHNNQLKTGIYWMPQFTETRHTDPKDLAAQMREIIRQSVSGIAADRKVGAFLSGGLDSSTVAGMLATETNESVHTYSIGFAVDGYDEMAYARIAAAHFGTHQHEYYVTPDDVVAAAPKLAAACDEPFGNSSIIPTFYCAQLAATDGLDCLLAGDGGDELFAGNARYARQKIFEIYNTFPKSARSAFELLLFSFPTTGPIGKAQSYVRQAKIPLPDRLETYNFLHRINPAEIFDSHILAVIDSNGPLQIQRDRFAAPQDTSMLNRMMYLDWQQTLADNDLRKVGTACRLAGIDVAYPLLNDALVEFSCSVPSKLKLPAQRLRHFYKEAMKGFLPDAIITKSKHGFGLPFGIWMRSHRPLHELAMDSLESLKARQLFHDGFIDRAITLHNKEHASYYGELIWLLMMLELWLKSHIKTSHY